MMFKIKYLRLSLLILCAMYLHSCKWRIEDQPGYWVITFPQDGATCNEIVTIGIDVNDPDGICGVEVSVNDLKIDVPLSEILGKINEEPIEIELNTNDIPDGPVKIAVSICDCNNNSHSYVKWFIISWNRIDFYSISHNFFWDGL